MTTYPFTPAPAPTSPPFQFQPTLDGEQYTASVTWNLGAQRWYLTLQDLGGNLIFTRSIPGSPAGVTLQSLSWGSGTVHAVAAVPHGQAIGSTVNLTVSGVTPDAYNGLFPVLSTGPLTLDYPLADNPGASSAPGMASYDVDLVWGYFQTSTMVFRQAAQQFEVSP